MDLRLLVLSTSLWKASGIDASIHDGPSLYHWYLRPGSQRAMAAVV